jgi:putative transcriptional regulator
MDAPNLVISKEHQTRTRGLRYRMLENWEQGRSKPTGAAWALLSVANRKPEIVFEVLT